MNIHQMSKQAGFKYGVKTAAGYVFLSQHTKGQCGRKIYINGERP